MFNYYFLCGATRHERLLLLGNMHLYRDTGGIAPRIPGHRTPGASIVGIIRLLVVLLEVFVFAHTASRCLRFDAVLMILLMIHTTSPFGAAHHYQ